MSAFSHWLIIPPPSFTGSDTLKGFLLAHPSFLIVLIFHWSYQAGHSQKDAASLFSSPFSSTPRRLLLFLSRAFQCWQNGNCKHTSSVQQLSKGAEWERNWSGGSQYSKQSLVVPCVASNYGVQEEAGFAWTIKRLKGRLRQKGVCSRTLMINLINAPRLRVINIISHLSFAKPGLGVHMYYVLLALNKNVCYKKNYFHFLHTLSSPKESCLMRLIIDTHLQRYSRLALLWSRLVKWPLSNLPESNLYAPSKWISSFCLALKRWHKVLYLLPLGCSIVWLFWHVFSLNQIMYCAEQWFIHLAHRQPNNQQYTVSLWIWKCSLWYYFY